MKYSDANDPWSYWYEGSYVLAECESCGFRTRARHLGAVHGIMRRHYQQKGGLMEELSAEYRRKVAEHGDEIPF